jgi:hypothetical protein
MMAYNPQTRQLTLIRQWERSVADVDESGATSPLSPSDPACRLRAAQLDQLREQPSSSRVPMPGARRQHDDRPARSRSTAGRPSSGRRASSSSCCVPSRAPRAPSRSTTPRPSFYAEVQAIAAGDPACLELARLDDASGACSGPARASPGGGGGGSRAPGAPRPAPELAGQPARRPSPGRIVRGEWRTPRAGGYRRGGLRQPRRGRPGARSPPRLGAKPGAELR